MRKRFRVRTNKSALEFLSGDKVRGIYNAWARPCYRPAELQQRFDFDPFVWWKSHGEKYHKVAEKAK